MRLPTSKSPNAQIGQSMTPVLFLLLSRGLGLVVLRLMVVIVASLSSPLDSSPQHETLGETSDVCPFSTPQQSAVLELWETIWENWHAFWRVTCAPLRAQRRAGSRRKGVSLRCITQHRARASLVAAYEEFAGVSVQPLGTSWTRSHRRQGRRRRSQRTRHKPPPLPRRGRAPALSVLPLNPASAPDDPSSSPIMYPIPPLTSPAASSSFLPLTHRLASRFRRRRSVVVCVLLCLALFCLGKGCSGCTLGDGPMDTPTSPAAFHSSGTRCHCLDWMPSSLVVNVFFFGLVTKSPGIVSKSAESPPPDTEPIPLRVGLVVVLFASGALACA